MLPGGHITTPHLHLNFYVFNAHHLAAVIGSINGDIVAWPAFHMITSLWWWVMLLYMYMHALISNWDLEMSRNQQLNRMTSQMSLQ